jgi:hypothetical protein
MVSHLLLNVLLDLGCQPSQGQHLNSYFISSLVTQPKRMDHQLMRYSFHMLHTLITHLRSLYMVIFGKINIQTPI